jgi:hypothetical protein
MTTPGTLPSRRLTVIGCHSAMVRAVERHRSIRPSGFYDLATGASRPKCGPTEVQNTYPIPATRKHRRDCLALSRTGKRG